MHHANWTAGIDNKLALLVGVRLLHALDKTPPVERVSVKGIPAPVGSVRVELPIIPVERDTVAQLTDHVRYQQAMRTGAVPTMPLALVLQFWEGDKEAAMRLARLLADIEPQERDDVLFVFAPQRGTVTTPEMRATYTRVGEVFPYTIIPADVDPTKKYPGICFDAWSSVVRRLLDAWYDGNGFADAFFFEADGFPTRTNWIDRLREAHRETILAGKSITGARMRVNDHINGTLCMRLRFWADNPGLHRCPPAEPWDVFHGSALVAASHPSRIICNEHGISITPALFLRLGCEAAWVTSVKDGSGQCWARHYLAGKTVLG
jgi:hypothetical protein